MTWSQLDLLSRAVRVGEIQAEEAQLDGQIAAFGKKDQVARYRRALEAERLRLVPRPPAPPPRAMTPGGIPMLSADAAARLEGMFGAGSGFGRKTVKLTPEEFQAKYGTRKRPGGPA
jgi:hypothetical protein